MLEKQTVVDKIEVLELGHIQVRRAKYILEDGVRISGPIYFRIAYSPGDEIKHEDERVQALANAAWTPDVVQTFHATLAASRALAEETKE